MAEAGKCHLPASRQRFPFLRQAAAATFQDLYPARLSQDVRIRRNAFSLDYSPINQEFARQFHVPETTLERHLVREPDIATERRELYERFDLGPQNAAVRTLHQIDPRDPTSDKLVWGIYLCHPPEQFLIGGHSRSLIRRAMQGRLPANTLARYARGHRLVFQCAIRAA